MILNLNECQNQVWSHLFNAPSTPLFGSGFAITCSFQDDFESFWECVEGAKTNSSLERGCNNQLFEMLHLIIDFGVFLGSTKIAKWRS